METPCNEEGSVTSMGDDDFNNYLKVRSIFYASILTQGTWPLKKDLLQQTYHMYSMANRE